MSWNKGGNRGPWGTPTGGGNTPSGGRPNGSGNRGDQPDLDQLIRKGQESLRNAFGGGNGGSSGGGDGTPSKKPFIIGMLVLVMLWLASGIYRVDADEQGVVLRFGQYHRITEPGLNYHLPFPMELAYTPRVTSINRVEIGFRTNADTARTRMNVPEESLMLTGDKNLVSAQFEVQWRIKDAVRFLFNLREPEAMVKPIAETSLREVMGNTPLSLALSDKRQAIAEETKQQMQAILDQYQTGIEIYEVNLLAVDAPDQVVEAFIDVLAAQQEKETLQNEARKYRDGIIPVAQGQAEKMIQDAEGYKGAAVSRASGEAARFMSVYNEYKNAKDVTRQRLYLETMEDMLVGMNKMVIDSDGKSGGVMPYLSLNDLKKAPKATATEENK
jgi:modulator of FtsH protease HflK